MRFVKSKSIEQNLIKERIAAKEKRGEIQSQARLRLNNKNKKSMSNLII